MEAPSAGASSPRSFKTILTPSNPLPIEYLSAFSLTIGNKSDSNSW